MARIEGTALRLIDNLLVRHNLSLVRDFPSLPRPAAEDLAIDAVEAELDRWDPGAQADLVQRDEGQLIPSQRDVYQTIMAAVDGVQAREAAAARAVATAHAADRQAALDAIAGNATDDEDMPDVDAGAADTAVREGTLRQQQQPQQLQQRIDTTFFLDAPGGYGKSFVANLLLATVRSRGGVALAVASSGIAALLMSGGTTAHSQFKIPIPPEAHSMCNLRPQTSAAKLVKAAQLIIWDEAPMTHKDAFGAVDRTLKDLMGNNLPFGGKVFVMAGDFRQVLPVVPRGSRASIVAASIKRHSEIWSHVRVLQLTVNMRVQGLLRTLGPERAYEQQRFADYLLAVGEGLGADTGRPLRIPDNMLVPGQTPSDLIREVFGDLQHDAACRVPETLMKRCILSPKNNDVIELNDAITEMLPGQVSMVGGKGDIQIHSFSHSISHLSGSTAS